MSVSVGLFLQSKEHMKIKTRPITVEFQTKDGDSVFCKGYETYTPERSKLKDTFTFKRFEPLFDPADPESVKKTQLAFEIAYREQV